MDTNKGRVGPLKLTQLNEQVYEVLREEIVGGKLSPGERLSLSGLAEELGVSVTPVRDALRRLSLDGLVEIQPRRGTFVSEFSTHRIREIFLSRRIIECAAAERAADIPDQAALELSESVDEIESLREEERFRDYERYIALDARFHRCIVGLLGSSLISDFYEQLRWPTQVVRGLSYSEYQRAQETVSEHAAIAQAFRRRDVAEAKAAILNHLTNAETDLLRHMGTKD
jgi:DNA-binding GntR family transcriptional regulator